MMITLTVAGVTIAALLTGLIYYKGKYWNYLEISEAAEREVDRYFEEYAEKEAELYKKTENEIASFRKKCARDFKKKLHKALSEKTAELEANYKTLAEQLELDYTNACEEIKDELFQQLSDVDSALEEHARNLAAKNILTFSCACSRDLIPCAIDFTKENTFICPKCQSKYKVAINANPVLIGRNVSDEEFAELVEKRLNENKETN
jgi:hypothetical protein